MPATTPRARHRATTWSEWQSLVTSDRFQPTDAADVIQGAFTRAALIAVAEDFSFVGAGARPARPRRERIEGFAEVLGVSRSTFEATVNGRRWVHLDEVVAMTGHHHVGPIFGEQFRALAGQVLGVLHTNQDSGSTTHSPGSRASLGRMNNDQIRKRHHEFVGLELHTLDSIERLALLQEQARLSSLRALDTTIQWDKIARAVGASPRRVTARGGMNGRLREAGVPNLTQTIREHVHGLETFTVDRVYKAITATFPDVLRGQVHDAVMRMKKSGDVVGVSRGVYAPTSRLRERVAR